MKILMTGNEAIARGAWEAGITVASAYPGTPSTEIMENMEQYKEDVYCEWAPNEKVAVETAIGASVAGVRALAAQKHVGLNVAADPIFTVAYTGVTGGLVLVTADDPGMHSSQNEQDNRNYATAARLLMLNPADSSEAKEFTKLGFELSEKFDTPVLLHVTTRICHTKTAVEFDNRKLVPHVPYQKNIKKFVATPANAKVLRVKLEERIAAMTEYSNRTPINKTEYFSTKIGIISSGVAYQYAREVFGEDASYLKLGMTFPMPMELIKEFASKVEKIYVIEEMDPYIENHLKMAGIPCIGKELIPSFGELNTDIIRKALLGKETEPINSSLQAVARPPVLCAGCPHRGFFYALSKKKNVMIAGDIGCYTLASAPPLSALDSCFCMGGSISTGHGAAQAYKKVGADTKVVACLGDSTFFHTGINSLLDCAYNMSNSTSVILDNRITGMTGHQENPGSGCTLMGAPAPQADIAAICQAVGIKKENIYIVNPLLLDEVNKALDEALEKDEPTVIITKWPCILKKFSNQDKEEYDLSPKTCRVDQDKCKKCRLCSKCGCPAIYAGDIISINEASCTGCGVCRQICPFGAIEEVK